MKNKFKVGDQVITREFPKDDGPGFANPMHELVGKQGTVVGCPDENNKFYTVEHMEDGSDQWWWPESALELVSEEKPVSEREAKMKTLDDCKKEVAKSLGMQWGEIILDHTLVDTVVERVARKYSEQQAIEFSKWKDDNYKEHSYYGNTEELLYKNLFDSHHETHKLFTLYQLYQKFKEEQK